MMGFVIAYSCCIGIQSLQKPQDNNNSCSIVKQDQSEKQKIKLFIYKNCYYCIRVLTYLQEHNLMDFIEIIDADSADNKKLLQAMSGKTQTPYLVDIDAQVCMPESLDIIAYLADRYGCKSLVQLDGAQSLPATLVDDQMVYDPKIFLEQVESSVQPVMILVSTTWCPPCKRLKPIFKSIGQEMSDVCRFILLDGDVNEQIVDQLGVRSYPTVICFKDGKRIDPVKYRSRDDLLQFIATIV